MEKKCDDLETVTNNLSLEKTPFPAQAQQNLCLIASWFCRRREFRLSGSDENRGSCVNTVFTSPNLVRRWWGTALEKYKGSGGWV